nr:MAG TPA: hypothetical protein [Inoviridae sp.]
MNWCSITRKRRRTKLTKYIYAFNFSKRLSFLFRF